MARRVRAWCWWWWEEGLLGVGGRWVGWVSGVACVVVWGVGCGGKVVGVVMMS